MKDYYSTYNAFGKAIKTNLIIDAEYKLANPIGLASLKYGGSNKKLYLVSFDGLKQLEINKNKATKLYYIQLEKCIQDVT
jgi:hypothetical protein